MKSKSRLLIILLIVLAIFLSASVVCAMDYTTLKSPKNFKAIDKEGVSEKETDGRVKLTIVPINENSTKYITGNGEKLEDNIYKYVGFGYSAKDNKFGFEGYTEIVEIDGAQYVVSVLFESKMSPSEEKEFLNVITEFNKLNNLKPIQIG